MWLIMKHRGSLFWDESTSYFQCWSSFRPGIPCWYDRSHAKEMTRAEAERVAANWAKGMVRVVRA